MGITKTEHYTDRQNEIASFAKILGHPARVAILQYLLQVEGCIGGEIVNEIGLSQPTISQHLKEMKRIGLIQGNIEGTSISYCVNPEVLNHTKQLFESFFEPFSKENGGCC